MSPAGHPRDTPEKPEKVVSSHWGAAIIVCFRGGLTTVGAALVYQGPER